MYPLLDTQLAVGPLALLNETFQILFADKELAKTAKTKRRNSPVGRTMVQQDEP